MSATEQDNNIRKYRITFPVDDDRYFRHSCDACGLHFKLAVDPSQFAPILSSPFEELFDGSEDVQSEAYDTEQTHLTCPYCGYTGNSQDMHTEELVNYAIALIRREFIERQFRRMFAPFEGVAPTDGLFSISISATTSPLSVQPIIGPELPDMKAIRLICCGKSAKILSHWFDIIHCPYCSSKTILQ